METRIKMLMMNLHVRIFLLIHLPHEHDFDFPLMLWVFRCFVRALPVAGLLAVDH